MKVPFHLLLAVQLVLMTGPAWSNSPTDCSTFTRGVFQNIAPQVKVKGKYNQKKSLPWLISNTGHYLSRLTKREVVDESQFVIGIPLNLLGERTPTFDDLFLKITYEYRNVPTPEGVINNNNIAFLQNIEIIDFFDRVQLEKHNDLLQPAFDKIRLTTRELVRKRSHNFINFKVTDDISIDLVPYFKQSTVDAYVTFMDLFFFNPKYDLLRSLKNKRINVENRVRDFLNKEQRNNITRADQSTLTQITDFDKYQSRLKKLKIEKFLADGLDRMVYIIIGALLIPISYTIDWGKEKVETQITGLDEGTGEDQIKEEEIKEFIETKVKENQINKLYQELLKSNSEFKKAATENGIDENSLLDIQVGSTQDSLGKKALNITLKALDKNGKAIPLQKTP